MSKKNLDNYLIAYPLFCNSKKFSLRSYLLSNNKTTYKEFRKFLIKKSVQPPREEYFNLVKMSVVKESIESKVDEVVVTSKEPDIQQKEKATKKTYKKRKVKVDEENTNE
jgi:hypothetical protein